MRTGHRLPTPADIELKFNPNHDERGRFTFGAGGAAGGRRTGRGAGGRSRATDAIAVDLKPLSVAERATVHAIGSTPSIMAAMEGAWQKTVATGREHGFMIYAEGNRYTAGSMYVGSEGDVAAMIGARSDADPLNGIFSHAVAWFHTHPGRYREAYRASNNDQLFGTLKTAITIVRTHNGYVVGK